MTKLLGPLLALVLALYAVPASAAPMLEADAPQTGHEPGALTDVPWDEVGPGWSLASVAHGPRTRDGYVDARQRTLELLSPAGARYELHRSRIELRPRGWYAGDFHLTDVDPARQTVLLVDSSARTPSAPPSSTW